MFDSLMEFVENKPPIKEKKSKWNDPIQPKVIDKFDAIFWESNLYGGGGHIGYMKSLTCSYIQLNLLLIDREKYVKRFGNYHDWINQLCLGFCDGGHPDYLVSKFERLFDNKYNLREFDTDMIELINEICKRFFECIYKGLRHKEAHEINIRDTIYYRYSIKCDLDWLFPSRYN